MKKFINRVEELSFLQSEYIRAGSSLVVLYGRRRVGKTELASHFIRDKSALYFLVTEESEQQNRKAFKNAIADFTENELLKSASIDDWGKIFEYLLKYKTDNKKVVVIDEFQYLGKSNPAFPSIFQKIWDTQLKEQNIMVILCGSLISMMESQTLAYSSPLYGRRTGQIKLKQIPFKHYHEFFTDKSQKELIEFYSVTGGVPKYVELFYDGGDVYAAIAKSILSKSSFLYDEPNFLLQREVTEVGSYFSIIKTIAAGNRKLAKIATDLELKQTGLTKYLKTLIDLDILEREVPVTEENPEKSKRGLYKIKDNFIKFWFQFVYPSMNFIETGHEEIVFDKIKKNLADNHIAYVYEDVCIEQMWELNAKNTWGFTFNKAGRWWSGNTEIDIVAYDTNGNDMIFGECKYWQKPVGISVLNSLIEKSNLVEWNKASRKNHYVLFSINGFSEELVKVNKERDDVLLLS